MSDTNEDTYEAEAVLDKAAIEAEILTGAKAFQKLLNHSADDWISWAATIAGLRGLRDLAIAKSHNRNIQSQAYRETIGALLQLKKYSVYDQIDKPTRSACYKLMDRLEEISVWYASLAPADQMRWKHPQSIMKHAPRHLVSSGARDNKPKPKPKKGKRKTPNTVEYERMRALALHAIKRLIKYEPDAAELLDQITPPDIDEPSDSLEDVFPEGRHLDA